MQTLFALFLATAAAVSGACSPSVVVAPDDRLTVAPADDLAIAPSDEVPPPRVHYLRDLDLPEDPQPAARPVIFPTRPKDAPRGTEFLERTAGLSIADRERAIEAELASGNVPSFLRRMVPVRLAARTERGVLARGWAFVLPDYLAIGDDADFVRIPMTPAAAQRIANEAKCLLPTKAIVDAVYRDAEVRLDPQPLTPGPAMRSNPYFRAHNDVIEAQLSPAPREQLVAGHKKDVVVTGRLLVKKNRVAIYGWHMSEEEPIQPLSTWHRDSYSDYSHGVRLVHPKVLVSGTEWDLEELMQHPTLSLLVSEEGPMALTRASVADPVWDQEEVRPWHTSDSRL